MEWRLHWASDFYSWSFVVGVVKQFYYHFLIGFCWFFWGFSPSCIFMLFFIGYMCWKFTQETLEAKDTSLLQNFFPKALFPSFQHWPMHFLASFLPLVNAYFGLFSTISQCIFWPFFRHWSMHILGSFLPLINTIFGPFSATAQNIFLGIFRISHFLNLSLLSLLFLMAMCVV